MGQRFPYGAGSISTCSPGHCSAPLPRTEGGSLLLSNATFSSVMGEETVDFKNK